MKKIISLLATLLIGSVIWAQVLDTVLVRNLQMQVQEWAWCVGKNGASTDSMTMVAYRRIEAVALANRPLTNTTNLTVDSLNGRVVMDFYRALLKYGSEIETRYSNIKSAISGKANLSLWTTQANDQKDKRKDATIKNGKALVVD